METAEKPLFISYLSGQLVQISVQHIEISQSIINNCAYPSRGLVGHDVIHPAVHLIQPGMHDEGHHPHIHLFVFSANPKEGYVTAKDIKKMESMYAKDIFREEMKPRGKRKML